MYTRHAPVILALSLLIAPSFARADEVLLANGDRMKGRIVNKTGDVLTLETDYAGQVKIKWTYVVSVMTDRPVDVMLSNAEEVHHAALGPAPLGLAKDRQLELEGTQSVPLDEVAYINPTPEESGLGVVLSGHINASAANTSGNTSSTRLYVDASIAGRAKAYRYGLLGKVSRSSDAGFETAANWLVGGNFDKFIKKDRFLYVRASTEHDKFKDIELRTAFGGGYGFQLVENERTRVALRGGLDDVFVNRIVAADEDYPAFGWGVNATHKIGALGIEFFHDHDGFWNLRDTSRVTIRSRTGLRVPLVRRINATMQANVDWDRNPAPGLKSTDTTLLFGVGYAF